MVRPWQDGHRWRSAAYWREFHEVHARDRQLRDGLAALREWQEDKQTMASRLAVIATIEDLRRHLNARARLLKYDPAFLRRIVLTRTGAHFA